MAETPENGCENIAREMPRLIRKTGKGLVIQAVTASVEKNFHEQITGIKCARCRDADKTVPRKLADAVQNHLCV